jgi:inositol-phosphate phosphatase/L-galactose 1-phosphate phosphatase/histidinol-phosphatase
MLQERWIGIDGVGSTLNGKPISVRDSCPLSQAVCYTSAPEVFEPEYSTGFRDLRKAVRWMLYNTDCYPYGLLACGAIDVVIERSLRPYRVAAAV